MITTVIPTYRRPHLLRRAIQSILNQTYSYFQVCVYDDASGDETSALVAEFVHNDARVKYYCHDKNIGMMANFKYAVESVTTPYFSLLCDDDLLLPTFYQTALACFEQHPNAAFVSTAVLVMDSQGVLIDASPTMPSGFYHPPDGLLAMIKHSKAMFTGTLYRKDVIDKIGAHDQGLGGASDVDLDLRIAAHFPCVVCAEPGAVVSVHPSSTSIQARFDFVWRDLLKIINKLEYDESISVELRSQASQALAQRLQVFMFNLGIVNILRGNYGEAERVSEIFRTYHQRRDKAMILSALIGGCRNVPGFASFLRAAQRARKRIRRERISPVSASLRRDLSWIHRPEYQSPVQDSH
ncbi:MAG: glycosyltransferase family 2 protein [Chloroflexota bacterium]|nr:glycosyltransferase family 2 protein [Chloroflexota bacterium]